MSDSCPPHAFELPPSAVVEVGTLSDVRPRPKRPLPVALELDGGQRVRIDPERPLSVGAGPQVDLPLDDPYISTRHATVRIARDGVVVEDLGSKNGTWVDGVAIERGWARLGAIIRFGRVSVRVVSGHAVAEPVAELAAREQLPEGPVVGDSAAFRDALRTLERAARVRSPVLLRGETGTGKEMAARVVHRGSERRNHPFVAINCGAIPEALAESELFGHVRGAFTGALRDRQGAFLRADGGTLLLDEVAELPPLQQAKLLRVLETGRVLPVGAEQEIAVDVRIVAATHRDLESMVEDGELREDLYHRLGVLTVWLPALRERPEDIPALLRHFATRATRELGYPVELTDGAVAAAVRYSWPGNIRALRNAVLRAGALADGPIEAHALLPAGATTPDVEHPPYVMIPRGDYSTMHRALLRHVVDEQGSIRRAAKALGVPRSTLGHWLRRPDTTPGLVLEPDQLSPPSTSTRRSTDSLRSRR
ncbi:sigma 54-interacting transcriptional regulator [Paraliomyxa miuraensis]|uniref:sigma 54-interacting transcriptional regulator n=1 Tax=Paraliomyxa miuraensis TaxID=376150 RepID=UPI0022565E19|nr:sigma 54-interacting transcriptional regulator [Paraliomyxa miuraensis]MCX4245197.1 sigma 54-interacting transcriptional regulator [Paraliomyxa miuraensis]